MSDIYVRSTDGSDADNGSTWALAKATLAGAAAIDAAGDTIYVASGHTESVAAAVNIALAGTAASPVSVVCVSDAAEPPTAVADTASVTTTGSNNIDVDGACYVYGLVFTSGNFMRMAAASAAIKQLFKNCDFILSTNSSALAITVGQANSTAVCTIHWQGCDVKFANAGQNIQVNQARFFWEGGSLLAGGVSPTNLVESSGGRDGTAEISGVDLSAAGAGINIFAGDYLLRGVIRNCKLPASWSGSVYNGDPGPGYRFEMYNCDSGDTNYKLQIKDYAGLIVDETTVVRTGGASDGTTSLSWRMTTTANAEYPTFPLYSPEIVTWNDTTGASKTVTVEIITDNVTLTDGECWLEVMYLGTSGVPLGSWISDAKADVLAAAANQTASSEAWTTTGLTTPVKQKLAVTFTPQEKGFIHARVVLAKASTTVYVDPKLTVS